MKTSFFFILFSTHLLSQNVDMYLSLIHEGQSQGVKENLPELSIENIKLINDIYSEDFIKFNYTKKI